MKPEVEWNKKSLCCKAGLYMVFVVVLTRGLSPRF